MKILRKSGKSQNKKYRKLSVYAEMISTVEEARNVSRCKHGEIIAQHYSSVKKIGT